MGIKKICLIIIPMEEISKSQQKSVLLSYVIKKDQIYDFGWKVGHTYFVLSAYKIHQIYENEKINLNIWLFYWLKLMKTEVTNLVFDY